MERIRTPDTAGAALVCRLEYCNPRWLKQCQLVALGQRVQSDEIQPDSWYQMLESCKFHWTCCCWSHDRSFKGGKKKFNLRDVSRGSCLHWKESSTMLCWCRQLRSWPDVSKGLFTLPYSKNLVWIVVQRNHRQVPKTSLNLRPLARFLKAGSNCITVFWQWSRTCFQF